ncbi:MAG: hypothetical protein AAB403_04625 [Planctomycetota bacterium]
MKHDNDNLPRNDCSTQLDQNISRLLKAASNSSRPGARFTESLIDSALGELRKTQAAGHNRTHGVSESPWLEKSLGWAAVVAAACSAGLVVIASILLKMSFLLQAAVVVTVLFNWFTYLGEYIR